MRHWKSTLLCLAAALALVTAGCANPAADAPQAEVSEPADEPNGDGSHSGSSEEGSSGDSLADGKVYKLAEGSSVGFVGSKVTGSHDGGFKDFSGEITVVDGDFARSRVEVAIETHSLWADNDSLTDHLKSADFFDVESYPIARFESTSIEPAEDGYRVTGDLLLHGVTKQISFPASIMAEGEQVTASAEFAIKRFDFDIEYAGKADDLIRDDVLIKLKLVGAEAPAPIA